MSSCSCQHLLIACNSSLRVTAGAAGLGPAPPAIACTHSQSWPGQGLPSPPPRSWGSQLSQGFPGQAPGQRCPPPALPGAAPLGFVRGIPPEPVPRMSRGCAGNRAPLQEGGWPCPAGSSCRMHRPPEHRPNTPFIPQVWLLLTVGQSLSRISGLAPQ